VLALSGCSDRNAPANNGVRGRARARSGLSIDVCRKDPVALRQRYRRRFEHRAGEVAASSPWPCSLLLNRHGLADVRRRSSSSRTCSATRCSTVPKFRVRRQGLMFLTAAADYHDNPITVHPRAVAMTTAVLNRNGVPSTRGSQAHRMARRCGPGSGSSHAGVMLGACSHPNGVDYTTTLFAMTVAICGHEPCGFIWPGAAMVCVRAERRWCAPAAA
jgi:hypothetical protein